MRQIFSPPPETKFYKNIWHSCRSEMNIIIKSIKYVHLLNTNKYINLFAWHFSAMAKRLEIRGRDKYKRKKKTLCSSIRECVRVRTIFYLRLWIKTHGIIFPWYIFHLFPPKVWWLRIYTTSLVCFYFSLKFYGSRS